MKRKLKNLYLTLEDQILFPTWLPAVIYVGTLIGGVLLVCYLKGTL